MSSPELRLALKDAGQFSFLSAVALDMGPVGAGPGLHSPFPHWTGPTACDGPVGGSSRPSVLHAWRERSLLSQLGSEPLVLGSLTSPLCASVFVSAEMMVCVSLCCCCCCCLDSSRFPVSKLLTVRRPLLDKAWVAWYTCHIGAEMIEPTATSRERVRSAAITTTLSSRFLSQQHHPPAAGGPVRRPGHDRGV